MIRLEDLTPEVYYRQSRDFQFIGRLYDLVLNSVKTNSDMLYNIPLSDNADTRLMDLMSLTLGFKSKHNYNVKQLTALCNAFAIVMRNKGNIQSIITACTAVLNAEGITKGFDHSYDPASRRVQIFLPPDLKDINLLKDLFEYIVPAGISMDVIRSYIIRVQATTEATSEDTVTVYNIEEHTSETGSKYNKLQPENNLFTEIATAQNLADPIKNGLNKNYIYHTTVVQAVDETQLTNNTQGDNNDNTN